MSTPRPIKQRVHAFNTLQAMCQRVAAKQRKRNDVITGEALPKRTATGML